jgi:hypothetical protein
LTVIPDWTDLKAAIAASWNVSWKVDPLPLSVPERFELLPDVDPLPLGAEEVVDEELQAAASRAVAARATPTVVARLVRRSRMLYTPFPVGEN